MSKEFLTVFAIHAAKSWRNQNFNFEGYQAMQANIRHPSLGLQKTEVRNMGMKGTAIRIHMFPQNFEMHSVCEKSLLS